MALKHLAVPGRAPAFAAVNEQGDRVTLSDFRGQPLVLYFYPKDDTPGCTAQACQLRDHISEFAGLHATVLGVSPDDRRSHTQFIEKYERPLSLPCGHMRPLGYGVQQHGIRFGRPVPA